MSNPPCSPECKQYMDMGDKVFKCKARDFYYDKRISECAFPSHRQLPESGPEKAWNFFQEGLISVHGKKAIEFESILRERFFMAIQMVEEGE